MTRKSGVFLVAVVTGLGMALGWAALAWACTPQAGISVTPGSGAVGATVRVRGNQFLDNQPVHLYWDKVGGRSLGTASSDGDGQFSAAVTIPADAAAGMHYVVAYMNSAGGGKASDTFEVISSSPEPPPSSPSSGAPDSPTAGAPTRNAPTGGVPGATPGRGKRPAAGRERPGRAGEGGGNHGAPKRIGHSGRGIAVRKAPTAGSKPGAVTTRSGRTVFGGSIGASGARGHNSGAGPSSPTSAGRSSGPGARASHRGRDDAGPTAKHLAGLPSPDDPALSVAKPARSPLMLGMGLLAVGLVAMFAGFLVAVVRRRRAPVESQG